MILSIKMSQVISKDFPPTEGECCGCNCCGICPSDDVNAEFELTEISSGAWKQFQQHWGYYVATFFLLVGTGMVGSMTQGMIGSHLGITGIILRVAIGIFTHWLMILITCNTLHASFEFMRGRSDQNVSCMDPFMNACFGGEWVWLVTKVWLMNCLIVGLGSILIFPGIYFMFALSFSYALAVDRPRLSAWKCCQLSIRVWGANWCKFFLLKIWMVVILIAGLLAFFVGFIPAYCVVTLMSTFIYRSAFGLNSERVYGANVEKEALTTEKYTELHNVSESFV
jgi:hypothetical protein